MAPRRALRLLDPRPGCLKGPSAQADNPDMPTGNPLVYTVFAALVFIGAVFGTIAVARVIERRNRRLTRERLHTLNESWRAHAADGGRAQIVRRQARAADESLFWTALETLTLALNRAGWRRLSDALETSRHVVAERRALRDGSPWRRELAARRLALLHARAPRRSLRRALQTGPEAVAYLAALGLAHQRDAWTLRWILDHPSYFATRPPRARTGLLRAFGAGAIPMIAARLSVGTSNSAFECAMIHRLGAAGHAPSAGPIAERLGSPELNVRAAAARALGVLGDVAFAGALLLALRDPEWEVRAQAARGLGLLGAAEAIPALAAALTDRSWWVRRHCAYALARLGVEGNAALRGEALVSRDPYARDMAKEALAWRAARRAA